MIMIFSNLKNDNLALADGVQCDKLSAIQGISSKVEYLSDIENTADRYRHALPRIIRLWYKGCALAYEVSVMLVRVQPVVPKY